jgi:Bifunctional DNA primase/polymerase, N-terminal
MIWATNPTAALGGDPVALGSVEATEPASKATTPSAPCAMLRAALAYAACGWPVFPCRPRDKRPLVKDWPSAASTDPATIRAWWYRCPTANIAIVCGPHSGLFAVDIDRHDGVDGEVTLAGLEAHHGKLPGTVTQRTGGGGRQLLFAYPCVQRIRNSVSTLGLGLDVRGSGGYIVAPPSIHPGGAQYIWSSGHAPGQLEIAHAPEWLLELLGPQPTQRPSPAIRGQEIVKGARYALAALRREVEAVAAAPRGQRNTTLNRAAYSLGQLVASGVLDQAATVRLLAGAALAVGLSSREVECTLRSGMEAGMRQSRRMRA